MKSPFNKILFLLIFAAIGSLWPTDIGLAQDNLPPGPIYIVEEGDTLSGIALQFGITVENLVEYNSLPDANSLFIGDPLVIPGLEDIRGILETRTVNFGENFRSLSRIYQIPSPTFKKLNRLVTPSELIVGSSLVLPIGENETSPDRYIFMQGQTLLEYAIQHNENPWATLRRNQLAATAETLPGDVLLGPSQAENGPGALPGYVSAVDTTAFIQGETSEVRVKAPPGLQVEGALADSTLHFFWEEESDRYIALQGVHALADPGIVPLLLKISGENRETASFAQYVRLRGGDFIFESITVPPSLIDPEVTAQEMETLRPILTTTTPEKMWGGLFTTPSRIENCINSTFGNRRSYNGSAFTYYHAGADLCGGLGAEVLAPARGEVLFSGLMEIRGNLTIIDHGWGVISSYFHQSEIFVEEGDIVQPGDVIGLVGSTGRSTGPHLHWELWVGGVPVDPLTWLEQQYP